MRISDWSSDVCSSDLNPGLDSSSRRGSVRVDDLGAGDQVVAAAAVAAEDQQHLDDLDQCADERDDPDGLDRQVAHTEQAAQRRLATVQVDDLDLEQLLASGLAAFVEREGQHDRSEARGVGKECVSEWRSWWARYT